MARDLLPMTPPHPAPSTPPAGVVFDEIAVASTRRQRKKPTYTHVTTLTPVVAPGTHVYLKAKPGELFCDPAAAWRGFKAAVNLAQQLL